MNSPSEFLLRHNAEDKTPSVTTIAMNLMKSTVFEVDHKGVMMWQDEGLASAFLHNFSDDIPLLTSDFEARLEPAVQRTRRKALLGLTWDGAQYDLTYAISADDGQSILIEERGQRLAGEGKTPHRVICILTKIQERKQAQELAVYHASFDDLTGIWNRTRLRESLNYLLSVAHRYDRAAGFIRLRLCNLEDINSNYGFEAGDKLLKAVAERLKNIVKLPDVVGRVSGDSFGIGLSECPQEALQPLSERIISDLSETPYPSIQGDLYAVMSASAVLLSKSDSLSAKSPEQAYGQTQAALDHAPDTQGKFVEYSESLLSAKTSNYVSKTQSDDILIALNSRRISLAYQPIVHAKSRDLHHYECLLRLRQESGGLISAGEFIQDAEKLGLVHLLDCRALELASVTLKADSKIKLALNVSAATIKNEEAAEDYLQTLKALGPLTKNITLELTETVAMEDPAMANRFSVEARMLGVEFSIDDFGSGYTTFQNLMSIEADSIKIDGSFIQGMAQTPHKQTFVRMMVDLAQTFSVKTVAEMVDNHENADLLTRLGVDYLQGYLFGIPSPKPVFKKLV